MTSRDAAGGRRPSWSAALAVALAAAATAGVIVGRSLGGGGFDIPWAPAWDLRLAFDLDGLAGLYGGLAAAIGVLVFLYASAYVPRHLAHQGRPRREEIRLHGAMALFLVSMIGLVTAQDLVALFVFWDLTAVASWLLIGFDHAEREARLSALMALLVTVVTAVLMLVGILLLRAEYGTTQLDELFAVATQSSTVTAAMVLIAIGALAKSAQVPFHFWLPRAMAAPTPVSAYLHSAAMVAAGVFLLSRVHPLLALEPALLDGLLVVGLASMTLGGLLALTADGLKRVLAYSTIAQYGYVVTMLGIGGAYGAAGACFYVVAHAIAKSALFMTAGAVTETAGSGRLSGVGGLLRRQPLLAAGSGAAAAAIAALPLTIGFFKDELFFKAAAEHSTWLAVLAVAGAALTFAYMARLWTGIFLGAPQGLDEPLERRLTWPVALLGLVAVAGGIVVGPFASLAEEAAGVTLGAPAAVDAAYHLDARAENLMALATYAAGIVVFLGIRVLEAPVGALSALGASIGPERVYRSSLRGLNRLSNRLHDIEVRDLRTRVAAVIVPASLLVGAGVFFTPTADDAYRAGDVLTADIPLIVALGVCVVAALTVTRQRRHLHIALTLSAVGFALATAYSLMGAPDVALVAVLIETIFGLLFVAVYARLPREILQREASLKPPRMRRTRDAIIAAGSGVVTTVVVLAAFSRDIPDDPTAAKHIALTDDAHGKDVVTVILADFRGLDTMVEITVIGVAMLAVMILLRTRRTP